MEDPSAVSGVRSDKPPTVPVKKDRQIVSWTPEEDNLLREQVSVNGDDNWTSIAAKFKDKTSRQCRRRWYTYLNSEGKKGGWTTEEDRILCEAQKIFGNRWTEIAKVVSGRTDNAVKNRFSTLCKKRAKHDALLNQNDGSNANPSNKKLITQNCAIRFGPADLSSPIKQIRYRTSEFTENHDPNERSPKSHVMQEVQLRPPLSVLPQNFNNVDVLSARYPVDAHSTAAAYNVSNSKSSGSFLSRNDPKLTALLQQAELLSSLALKVNSEDNNQTLDNAWKELQDYLVQSGEHGMLTRSPEMDILLDGFKDLIEGLQSSSTGGQLSQSRQPDLPEESQSSSEYSTGPVRQPRVHASDQTEDSLLYQTSVISCHQQEEMGSSLNTSQEIALFLSEEPTEMNQNLSTIPSSEFDSPLQTVPTFKSLTEGIPSPKFSTSERQFLRSVLGESSPVPTPSSTKSPLCKRVLLDSLQSPSMDFSQRFH